MDPILELVPGKPTEIGKLLFTRSALGRKLEIVFDEFPQQTGQETEWQPLERPQIAGHKLPRLRRIACEILRLEIAWKHSKCYNNSWIGLPCANDGEKPIIAPSVGTRSVDS